jgi:formyltetrahydrofolate deformylase
MSRRQILSISVVGKDRTGVVAAATKFLFEMGANVEALEEQVTRGEFSMAIQASWAGADWEPGPVREGLKKLGQELGMDIRSRQHTSGASQRFAIFVSKEDHALRGILEAVAANKIKANPVAIISNHEALRPIAKRAQLPFRRVDWTQRGEAEIKSLKLTEEFEVDFVVLARFMKILSPRFVWHFKNKIINIHPSLLPSFPGPQAYRQAYEHGVKIAGVTAHFVNMHLDEGPIIAQSSFEVKRGMGLMDIVKTGQKHETKTLVKAVKLYLNRRLDVHWGTVKEI